MDGTLRLVGEFPTEDGSLLILRSRMTYDPSTQMVSGEQMYELISPEKKTIDRRVLGINFYLFQKSEFESLAEEMGFCVTSLYGDYERKPFREQLSPFMIWKLTKKRKVKR